AEQDEAEQRLRAKRMDVPAEEQLRVQVEQKPRHQENRPERAKAAGLRRPVLLRELEREASRSLRIQPLERDQRDDEDRGEAPGDLGGRAEPAQSLALEQADQERDEKRVTGPA